jgi:hypothetical protein
MREILKLLSLNLFYYLTTKKIENAQIVSVLTRLL